MLYDAKGFDHIYIATGYTDMRKGIDGLIAKVGYEMGLNPFQERVLFLFCGRASNKIKGLVWEKDGFLLLYKRVDKGSYIDGLTLFGADKIRRDLLLNDRLCIRECLFIKQANKSQERLRLSVMWSSRKKQ